MKKNILQISPNFNLACGVSKNVFTLLTSKELLNEFNLFFVTNASDVLSKLDKYGVNYTILKFNTDQFFHFDLFKNVKELKNICAKNDIHLIHSHHRYPAILANNISKQLGIKTVVTAHNFVKGFKQFSYKSDKIIAVSNSVKNHLVNYFNIPNDKINILYNCLADGKPNDKTKEEIKKELNISNNMKILLYVGRFTKEKGIDTLITSFKEIKLNHKNTLLLLVGDNKSCINIVNENNIKIFAATEDVTMFYQIADFLILPSGIEGLGYTMLEAGMHKLPFIGTNTGGIAEFIEDGVNGYLFEPGNADELVEKIDFVLNQPEKTLTAAEKLYEKVLTECNCSRYFEKLIHIYNNLLSNK